MRHVDQLLEERKQLIEENIQLRICCSQRGARMQVLRELFRDIDWHQACYDNPEMEEWFDHNGVAT